VRQKAILDVLKGNKRIELGKSKFTIVRCCLTLICKQIFTLG
jgi:hypothetical protein